MWSIIANDEKALKAVTDKIKSKMETAKLLSGVITLVLTALLTVIFDDGKWNKLADRSWDVLGIGSLNGQHAVRIAFVGLLVALGLFLATMYAYDRLLMPTRFWSERLQPPKRHPWLPRRPPGSSAWVLFRNMQRTWFYLFTPATLLVAAALTLLVIALLEMSLAWQIAVFAVAVALAYWIHRLRPVLGSED